MMSHPIRLIWVHWLKAITNRSPDGRLDTNIHIFDLCHIYMSYLSYVIISHIMTYYTCDMEIGHKSNLLILVFKRLSGSQQTHPFIQFLLKNRKI